MKLLLLIGFLSLQATADVGSINPPRVITPLVQIFSPLNVKIDETKMQVRVSSYNKRGVILKGKGTLEMSMPDYNKALTQSKAVYEMGLSKSYLMGHPEVKSYFGTAFHIGENLVLTNHHVLSPERYNTTECRGFSLSQNDPNSYYPCKKVHYCNAEHDVCLIEMGPKKNCLNGTCTKYISVEMKEGEALKLKENPKLNFDYAKAYRAVLTAIGNTMGFGIHYSQGHGIGMTTDFFVFYAPLRSGNSGGPLIGEDGLAWGVVRSESDKKVNVEAFNVATSMNRVISLIREQVTDAKTLENFNKAVVK